MDDINAMDVANHQVVIGGVIRSEDLAVDNAPANDELIKTQLQTLVIFAFMNPIVNVIMYILRYHTQ